MQILLDGPPLLVRQINVIYGFTIRHSVRLDIVWGNWKKLIFLNGSESCEWRHALQLRVQYRKKHLFFCLYFNLNNGIILYTECTHEMKKVSMFIYNRHQYISLSLSFKYTLILIYINILSVLNSYINKNIILTVIRIMVYKFHTVNFRINMLFNFEYY